MVAEAFFSYNLKSTGFAWSVRLASEHQLIVGQGIAAYKYPDNHDKPYTFVKRKFFVQRHDEYVPLVKLSSD